MPHSRDMRYCFADYGEDYIHIGVGSVLLVLTISGNARASRCGTSNDTVLTLFLYYNFNTEFAYWRTGGEYNKK